MKLVFPKGTTSRIVTVFIQDSSSTAGAGLGSLDESSSIVGGYVREGSTGVALAVDENVTTEGTYQAPSAVGKVRIGTPANMTTGTYELHFHNDLFASGAESVVITLAGATNMAPLTIEIQLSDPVRGLGAPTALPNAAADAAGGLPISDAGGLDIDTILGRVTANVATATALATAQADLTTLKKGVFAASELAIDTVSSQTELILTSGPSNDIDNVMAIIFDNSDSDTPVMAEGSYVGSTGTLTLDAATDITITTSDTVTLVFVASQSSDVNVVQISGSATAADNLELAGLAYSATRGLAGTALPAAAADAAGGLPVSDAGGLDLDTLLSRLDEAVSAAKTLTSAYDAAKTAAQAGDEMDLVDSPNGTAITAIGTALEAMMLDEGDASALLAAIAAKVEAFLNDEGDSAATLAAIAAAVWSNATRSLTDKAGFSLSSSQAFDLTGNITGNVSGSVGSVTGGINTGSGTITTLDGLNTELDDIDSNLGNVPKWDEIVKWDLVSVSTTQLIVSVSQVTP